MHGARTRPSVQRAVDLHLCIFSFSCSVAVQLFCSCFVASFFVCFLCFDVWSAVSFFLFSFFCSASGYFLHRIGHHLAALAALACFAFHSGRCCAYFHIFFWIAAPFLAVAPCRSFPAFPEAPTRRRSRQLRNAVSRPNRSPERAPVSPGGAQGYQHTNTTSDDARSIPPGESRTPHNHMRRPLAPHLPRSSTH
jgi:hypothetical protein